MIVALTGGVGGAKLAWGLSHLVPPDQLKLIVNTGDDFEHLGLHVSPDLDTVTYTLAGIANPVTGWGAAGETWEFMGALSRLGGPEWFLLGDRDLALHVLRTARLRQGETLTRITADFCGRLGVRCAVLPMSDDAVRTIVHTEAGRLGFQDYFVMRRCEPRVLGVAYDGAGTARANPEILRALADPSLEIVVICPSNPYLSVDPILAIPALRQAIQACRVPRIAVSPIIGGAAVKGPAAKMMGELGVDVSALGVARHYQGVVDCLVVDEADASLLPAIEALGMRALATPTLMLNENDRARLAGYLLDWRRSCVAVS